jgi:uncharacterized NAD(P)/FAD-binding protein YdhS
MRTIAIIGGGFTGTMVAVRLLRADSAGPLRIVLIDRSGRFGRGVAYGTTCSDHLLNVPAGRMSAFEEDPDSFLRWARGQDPAATGGSFLPRMAYGQYLESLLASSELEAAAKVERISGEVVDAEFGSPGAKVSLRDGRSIPADTVVLALGNFPPSDPRGLTDQVLGSRHYFRDPWDGARRRGIAADDPVVLIGTGLTMVDLALELAGSGHRGPIYAISRRGLLPRPHRSPAKPSHPTPPADLDHWPPTTRGMLRRLRKTIDEQAKSGVNWREVITSLRHETPRLWQRLNERERRRFLAAVRPFWEVHRHRAAPQAWETLVRLRDAGQLRVIAARISGGQYTTDSIRLRLIPRGTDEPMDLRARWVINCTGPDTDLLRNTDPLIANLRLRGMIRPDPLGLGLDATDNGAAIDAFGNPSGLLYLAGPLRKGQFWENTAVPELRIEVAKLADYLIALPARPLPDLRDPAPSPRAIGGEN